jgi:Holliday junction resolvase-like predicted endonuclease
LKDKTKNNEIGKLGEDLACRFLVKHGFKIIDRNYWKKWGEIDIISQKVNKLHFVEVKSVSRESLHGVSCEKGGFRPKSNEFDRSNTQSDGCFRPEDNMHPWKLQRLSRTIQTYLLEKDVSDETEWQFNVITVYIDMKRRVSRVFLLEDVIL